MDWGTGYPTGPSARRKVRGVVAVHSVRRQCFVGNLLVGRIHIVHPVLAHVDNHHRDRSLGYSWRASNRRAATRRAASALMLDSSGGAGVCAGCCVAARVGARCGSGPDCD